MKIRKATRADVPAIVALYADDVLGRARETPDALDVYYAAFDALDGDGRGSGGEILVGERDGRIVATLQLTMIQQLSHRGSKIAEIEAVRVASDLRGGGLGAAIVQFAVERARAAGCVRVQLTSNKERLDAHRFYERLGFRRSHEGFKLYFSS
ncbi:MAG TPA: GNAT family N-acetyltransferase [Polyangia bacterium]